MYIFKGICQALCICLHSCKSTLVFSSLWKTKGNIFSIFKRKASLLCIQEQFTSLGPDSATCRASLVSSKLANTVHDQLCLLLLGKSKQSQMPYGKVNGSLLFLGKASAYRCFAVTGVCDPCRGRRAIRSSFDFWVCWEFYLFGKWQSFAKHTGAGLNAAGFLLPLARFQPQQPPSLLLFSFAYGSVLSVVQGKSFQVWSNPVSHPGASSHLAGAGNPARPGGTRVGPRLSETYNSAVKRAVRGPEHYSIRVLPLPLHPVCLRPFPLDYLLKSILMDFLIVIFFSFFFNSFPTTPPQHFPSLVTGVLASSPPLHQSTVSSQDCNLYNFSCLLCLIVSFVISHPLSFSVHSEYPGWLK